MNTGHMDGLGRAMTMLRLESEDQGVDVAAQATLSYASTWQTWSRQSAGGSWR